MAEGKKTREVDNRRVITGITTSSGYTSTDPDEIEENIPPKEGERLIEEGALAGDWSFAGKEADNTLPLPEGEQLVLKKADIAKWQGEIDRARAETRKAKSELAKLKAAEEEKKAGPKQPEHAPPAKPK